MSSPTFSLATGLLRLAALIVLIAVTTCALITAHAIWLAGRGQQADPASLIIVLGGGVHANGVPGPDTLRRTHHGIALYRAGLAPRLHFTGGHGNPDVVGLGDAMALVAMAEGVPEDAISTENQSYSTLQNALFSADVVPPGTAGPVILVSDGYHLARAWASFRWAGYRPVSLSAPSAFGGGPVESRLRRIGREALAWWYNAGRLTLWSVLDWAGVDRARTIDLLASGDPALRDPV